MSTGKLVEGLPRPRGHELAPRHREVLTQGLRLFAERGYAGASLRELARRLGIRQPSLYHYFASKDALVEQIIDYFGVGGAGITVAEAWMPAEVEELPAAISAYVRFLYDHTDWPLFVRFMFALASENRSFAPRLREMFVEQSAELTRLLLAHYVESGQMDATEVAFVSRMVLSATALPLIEERLLFPEGTKHPDLDAYLDFVVRTTRTALEARKKR